MPIEWTTNRWHLIALTYSSTNSALYVDGELATNGAPVTCLPGSDALTNGFFIGSASNGTAQAHGMFDGLATYANPIDAGTIQSTYWQSFPIYNLNPMNKASWASAPSYITNSPGFRAISGPGYLQYVGLSSTCVTNSNVWITNVTARLMTNGTTTVGFTIMGGDPSLLYDAFGTAGLVGNNITNAQWVWLGQGSTCRRYSITGLPGSAAYLILGTPLDSDQDGLTDAYELLVSHTDPNNPDTDGDGIPDWFGAVYFGSNGLDPYALCPSGDGWTLLQAYQNGWNPNVFYTPPPPRNVAAHLDSTGTNVVITWASGGGPVSNYVVHSTWFGGGYGTQVATVGQTNASSFALAYSPGFPLLAKPPFVLSYFVSAYFPNGTHADSVQVPLWNPSLTPTMAVVRGPMAGLYLAVSSPLPTPSRIRLFWWSPQAYDTLWIDVDATNVVNGTMRIPQEQMTDYIPGAEIDVQAIATDVDSGAVSYLSPYVAPEEVPAPFGLAPCRFVDTRSHLKENLKFLLRSATLSEPFSYGPGDPDCGYGDPNSVWFPETQFARPPSPTSYEYSGFHVFSSNLNYAVMQEFRPAQENYLWRNLAYDPGDFDSSGLWTNGVGYYEWSPGLRWLCAPKYQFTATNADPIPLGLSTENYQYFFARYGCFLNLTQFTADLAEVGMLRNATNHVYVPSGVRNTYGLLLDSVLVPVIWSNTPITLTAGGPPSFHYGEFEHQYYFTATEAPSLQTKEYYFASQTRYLNSDYTGWPGSGPLAGLAPPLPGSPTFSVTNASPLLIAGFGQPITVAGWAKQAITNGYSGKYAYLEQYFTNAYTIDANGNVTTNSAGLLSPYGEFFPMQAGPAALVTMPDIDPPYQRGTGVVNVIKLQTDVDHNQIMDLSFAGPDNTSQARPALMWVNNDCDWPTLPGYPNFDPGQDKEVTGVNPGYELDCRQPTPRSVRDLEDYARLWICGVPALTNAGYQVSLSWSNVSSGNPAINFIQAIETNGGTLYLTDPNIRSLSSLAWNQIQALPGPGLKHSVTTTNPCTLPITWFTNAGNKYFLFEGASIGSGQLVLTISQNGQTIAQTGMWLDLHDVRDFIEQARITNVVTTFPAMRNSTNTSAFTIDHYATVPSADDDKRVIVLVHGWNNGIWQSENYAETMFKRLWWQGYRGRFVALRWPTLTGVLSYNYSEYIAFRSAAGASAFFDSLRARFPDYTINVCAHSMGNIVMMETLKLQLAAGSHSIDNYVLMEGAVPAHCYDTNAPVCPGLYTTETPPQTPDTYRGYPGAINAAINGRMFNFFNTNDVALALWVGNQLAKPQTPSYYMGANLQPFLVPNTLVTDPREVMAFCARPRSYAVGAQSGVLGVIHGDELDLTGQFQFGDSVADHSGQWKRSIQEVWNLYSILLDRLQGVP